MNVMAKTTTPIATSPGDTDTSTPYLRITNLIKRFGAFTALHEIALDIHEGEFVCFLGPSGCGKTTLLRAVAGLDIQTHGSITQGGRDISALPPSKRDFGIVFQSYALFPNLTVYKNIAYGLENRRVDKRRIAARVNELLELVGLPDQGGKYPAQLSGGQQQRIALARAIATSPGLLLLDEPLSALDAKVRVHLRHEVKELQRQLGVTTIMVTHDQDEAMTMADRIVVMNNGVIEQVGSPKVIYRAPRTPFAASFIGTTNFLAAEVVDRERLRVGARDFLCRDHGFAPGQAVRAGIRPESISVQPTLAREGRTGEVSDNSVTARVDWLSFQGSFFRAHLIVEEFGDEPLLADLSVNLVEEVGIDSGSELVVTLPGERLLVYPEEG